MTLLPKGSRSMSAYHAIVGETERNDGRPSSANSSQRGSRYVEASAQIVADIEDSQMLGHDPQEGGKKWA